MQGIIIAAGMGKRMGKLTKNKPKCLLKLDKKSLLELAIEGLRHAGCEEVFIITGYKEDEIKSLGYKTIYNKNYKNNNILHSFFNAMPILNKETIVSYSDIYVEKEIIKELSKMPGDIVLTVDKDWKSYYKNRNMHPLEQAEKVILNTLDNIDQIGKKLILKENTRTLEFIGLFKISQKGTQIMTNTFQDLNKKYDNNQVFEQSESWEKSYLTDFFQYIINNKISKILPHIISKSWAEFDTIEDYERFERIKNSQKLLSL